MRARYLGDHSNFTSWGIPFPRGVFVEVGDPHAQKKIAGNNHFEVENSDAEDVVFTEMPKPVIEAAPVVVSVAYEDGSQATGTAPLPALPPSEQDNAEEIEPVQHYQGARRGPKPKNR